LFQMFLARLLSKLPKLLPVVLPATRFVLILTETFTAGGEMNSAGIVLTCFFFSYSNTHFTFYLIFYRPFLDHRQSPLSSGHEGAEGK